MGNLLNELPGIINAIFGILNLIIVHMTLLGLMILGAYSLLCHSRKRRVISPDSYLSRHANDDKEIEH